MMVEQPISKNRTRDSMFFSRLALIITAIVFSGVILSWVVNPELLDRISTIVTLHVISSSAWYLLLVYQLKISERGNMALHKLLGQLSVVLVIAIFMSGIVMVQEVFERMANFGIFDIATADGRLRAGSFIGGAIAQWTLFVCLYILGVLTIKYSAHHKRLMVGAAILMMPEGLNRIVHLLELPNYSMLLTISIIFISMMIYDLKSTKRILWSTLVSYGIFILLAVLIFTVFRTQFFGDLIFKP